MPALRKLLLPLAALLTAAPAAQAEQWFALTGTDPSSTLVEVDLPSVRLRGSTGEAVIRVTLSTRHPHPAGFGYQSFVATAQIDCHKQEVSLASAAYYALAAGQGMRVGADSTGRQQGMPRHLLDAIPPHARQALTKAACPGSTP
jgi:hypothetical protein